MRRMETVLGSWGMEFLFLVRKRPKRTTYSGGNPSESARIEETHRKRVDPASHGESLPAIVGRWAN